MKPEIDGIDRAFVEDDIVRSLKLQLDELEARLGVASSPAALRGAVDDGFISRSNTGTHLTLVRLGNQYDQFAAETLGAALEESSCRYSKAVWFDVFHDQGKFVRAFWRGIDVTTALTEEERLAIEETLRES